MRRIRRLTLAALLAALVLPAIAGAAETCIDSRNIRSTHATDDSTILFTMIDGKVWKNALKAPCSQLQFRDAFTYADFGGTICANQQRIRVLEAPSGALSLRNLGAYCQLGDFTLQTP
jgi:hypothetical protein